MVPKFLGQDLEGTLGVNIGFYDTGHPSMNLRDERGDRCLTVDYRGYVPNLHVAVPMGYTRDIEVLFDNSVILSRKPVKTVLHDSEPIGLFQLSHRGALEALKTAEKYYSADPYVNVDVVSLQNALVRGPFRVSCQDEIRKNKVVDTVNPENNPEGETVHVLEYVLEKAKERWGNNSEVGILFAQDGDGHSKMGYTGLAWFMQENLRTLIIDELTKRHGVKIQEQYLFEDEWAALKRMIQNKKVPHIRLGDEAWEIKYYEFPLEYQEFGYNDWYYQYDCLGLHRVESILGEQHQDNTEELKFTLLDKKNGILPQINQDHAERDTTNEFTLRNPNEYPWGVLEYATQHGRNIGLPHNNIRIVVGEMPEYGNSVSNDIIIEVMDELKKKRGFSNSSAECWETPLEHLRALIASNNQMSIILPSGQWTLRLKEETLPERRIKNSVMQRFHKKYQILELTSNKDDR